MKGWVCSFCGPNLKSPTVRIMRNESLRILLSELYAGKGITRLPLEFDITVVLLGTIMFLLSSS